MVKGYQRFAGPFLPPMCRFSPSCSNYALDALEQRRLLPALFMIVWRLLRCNPFCNGGNDPVIDVAPKHRPHFHTTKS